MQSGAGQDLIDEIGSKTGKIMRLPYVWAIDFESEVRFYLNFENFRSIEVP